MTSRRTLGRRALLRGMLYGSAVSVGLPALELMLNSHGTAHADGTAFPKRFGIFFWGNGVRLKKWVPSAQGAAWQLSEELAPLKNVKSYVSVVSGYSIKTGNEHAHHAGSVGILSGAPMILQEPKGAPFASTFRAPTIDQVVAASISDKLRFRSLELGVSRNVYAAEGTTLRYLSHNGPNNPNPPEYMPSELYKRLFGSGFKQPGQTSQVDPKLALRRSVLSAVREDAVALKRRLGVDDQRRVEQHMESIRALETQILAIETAPPPPSACMKPAAPTTMIGDKYLSAVNEAMCTMAALALACDQTRVFSLMFSGGVGSTSYPELSISEHHALTHNEGGEQPRVHSVTTFIMRRFAKLLELLAATPQGAGNLLDSCVILGTTDTAEGLAHSISDYPILIAGKGGGSLRHPGIHVRGDRLNTSDALLTILRAMGLGITEFGQGGGRTTNTIAALLT